MRVIGNGDDGAERPRQGDPRQPHYEFNLLRHCAGELAAVDDPGVPPLWHALRCRLFAKLASFLGAAALPAFFDDLLDPARFDGIAPVEPEMAFTDVPGREHVCPGAPVYRPLPS